MKENLKQTNSNGQRIWIVVIIALIAFIAGLLLCCHSSMGSWLILDTLGAIAIFICVQQTVKWWHGVSSPAGRNERFLKMIGAFMGLLLVSGAMLYLAGFMFAGLEHNGHDATTMDLFCGAKTPDLAAEYLWRSLIASIGLFLLDIENTLMVELYGHPMLKGLIATNAVLSFSCTMTILINLTFSRLRAYIKFRYFTHVNDAHNHVYLFFGMNDKGRVLARDIYEKEKDKAVIIIVENSDIKDNEHNGWSDIFSFIGQKREYYNDAEELHARITFCYSKLCNLDIQEDTQMDIFGDLNLPEIRRKLKKLNKIKNARLSIFFLDENEEENVRSVAALSHDKTLQELSKSSDRVCIYCHARRNGMNRVIEDIALKNDLEVRIIDSAYLAVETLKQNGEYHPVHLVTVEKNATVSSEFNCLVIGFDEAGQDAMRFLYEFGAFVDSRSTDSDVRRSPFHCIAIDPRMDMLEGSFKTFTPALWGEDSKIELLKCKCLSDDFFRNVLHPIKDKLNYVIITVGDDDLGMECAESIFNYLRRFRVNGDMSQVRIMVRIYSPDKESFMEKTADHHNEGYRTDIIKAKAEELKVEVSEVEKVIATEELKVIVPFGKLSDIYTFDMIIQDRLTAEGKAFYDKYRKHKGASWEERHNELSGRIREEKGEYETVPIEDRKISLNNLRKLRRKETQDLCNALHAQTKIFLLRKALGEEYAWDVLLRKYFKTAENGKSLESKREGRKNTIRYPELDDRENAIILNLARLEHLRWNASHEMLGYTRAHDGLHTCDELSMEHNCLRAWQELDEESDLASKDDYSEDYKKYDFNVVDTSIMLHKDELKNTGKRS